MDTNSNTPLQNKLANLANQFTKIGLISSGIILLTLLIRLLINALADDFDTSTVLKYIAKDVSLAITLIVVAVPEGLPLTIGITLAYSVMRMKNDGVLVKNLNSPEIMGNIEEICTGKTGTLTKNEMKVVYMYA